ncbi:MAG: glycosyltransferase family 2 protein [Bdellovibrionia bacterium]
MKVSGFTLLRNGTQFDYPFLESLHSLLPVVDELVINVGIGDDDTLEQVNRFAKTHGLGKVRFFESDWQLHIPEKKQGGLILSEQTNLALDACTSDWCVYLQADEVLHEKDMPQLKTSLQRAMNDPQIEGLVFDYWHFYGSFDVIQHSRSTYRREVRAIRKSAQARSVGDAQSFRKVTGEKLRVIPAHAHVYHYGWVRKPDAMKEKTYFLDQLYHGSPTQEDAQNHTPHTGTNYQYKRFWGLSPFLGTHPAVMKKRIQAQGWNWDLKSSPFIFSWRDFKRVVLDSIEKVTGHRLFEYRSYKLIKKS